MAGGGTAPPLKLGDVLLLIGITLLVGTLFIQEWDIPTKVDAGDDPFEGNSRTFSGDVIDITVLANNASDVRIEVFEDGEEVYDETLFCDDSRPAKVSFESKGGQLAWKITMPEDVGGEIDVDLERAYFLNFLPYILGALITTAGVMKRKSDEIDKADEVLDAIIADED
tara:strand:+ start:331 stop:837 length:507 start_codon:yes stop_codon:yes gene_type:complete